MFLSGPQLYIRYVEVLIKTYNEGDRTFYDAINDDQIIEVNVPGLTTPVLSQVPFQNVPRLIYPLDPDMEWEVQVQTEFD